MAPQEHSCTVLHSALHTCLVKFPGQSDICCVDLPVLLDEVHGSKAHKQPVGLLQKCQLLKGTPDSSHRCKGSLQTSVATGV